MTCHRIIIGAANSDYTRQWCEYGYQLSRCKPGIWHFKYNIELKQILVYHENMKENNDYCNDWITVSQIVDAIKLNEKKEKELQNAKYKPFKKFVRMSKKYKYVGGFPIDQNDMFARQGIHQNKPTNNDSVRDHFFWFFFVFFSVCVWKQ